MTGTTTMTRIGGYTKEQAIAWQEAGIRIAVVSDQRADGHVEIVDRRPLVEKLNTPIRGRGIVYTFGDGHFVLTQAKYEQIKGL